jgi:transposase
VELYRKVRRAYLRQGISKRTVARHFGISRDSVDKMIEYSVPPFYRRTAPIKRPKLDGFAEIIDQWLREDADRPRKQLHTVKRVLDRLALQKKRQAQSAQVYWDLFQISAFIIYFALAA